MSNSKSLPTIGLVLCLGFIAGGASMYGYVMNQPQSEMTSTTQAEYQKKPLYWVAPMDDNYRRDKPGLSPMGMDLVAVYAPVYTQKGADNQPLDPFAITISPTVIQNLGIVTSTATQQPLIHEILTYGTVEFNQEQLVHIHPRVSGWIESLSVTSTGDTVSKGQQLYTIYAPELVNAQEEFVLALNRNNTRLQNAAKQRLMSLGISDKVIQILKKTKKVQQTVAFHAPQDGVVENLKIREGFYVQPGTTMLSIGGLEQVWIEAEVPEQQAGLIQVGDQVTLRLNAYPGQQWQARLDYMYPAINDRTRTLPVRIQLNNPEQKLKPNMLAKVEIKPSSTDTVLTVPKDAVIRTGSQDRVVLALGNGQFKSIAVTLGQSNQTLFEIIDGLSAGDKVVTTAQFLLDSESSKTSDFQRLGGAVPLEKDAAKMDSHAHEHHMGASQ